MRNGIICKLPQGTVLALALKMGGIGGKGVMHYEDYIKL